MNHHQRRLPVVAALAGATTVAAGDSIRRIAHALGDIDTAEAAALLGHNLDVREPLVRAAAADPVSRMQVPSAAAGMAKALGVELGETSRGDRSPVVRATVARRAAARKAASPDLVAVLDAANASAYTSVQFLARCGKR